MNSPKVSFPLLDCQEDGIKLVSNCLACIFLERFSLLEGREYRRQMVHSLSDVLCFECGRGIGG